MTKFFTSFLRVIEKNPIFKIRLFSLLSCSILSIWATWRIINFPLSKQIWVIYLKWAWIPENGVLVFKIGDFVFTPNDFHEIIFNPTFYRWIWLHAFLHIFICFILIAVRSWICTWGKSSVVSVGLNKINLFFVNYMTPNVLL